MSVEQLLREKRAEIARIATRHGALNLRIFGSVARGDAGPKSDIDLLVDVGPVTTAWFPAGLILDLEEMLGRRVEVVTAQGLRDDLREHILREAVPL
ncbi:MAG: nucleotidyltransferase family protein [Pseudomonadota bacterium]